MCDMQTETRACNTLRIPTQTQFNKHTTHPSTPHPTQSLDGFAMSSLQRFTAKREARRGMRRCVPSLPASWGMLHASRFDLHTMQRMSLICSTPSAFVYATLSLPRTCHPYWHNTHTHSRSMATCTRTHTRTHTVARWPFPHSRPMAIPDCKRDGSTHTQAEEVDLHHSKLYHACYTVFTAHMSSVLQLLLPLQLLLVQLHTHTHTHMHTFARWPYTHTHSRSMAIPDCKRDGHTHTPTSNHTHKHSTDTLTSDATHHMRIPQARRRTSQSLVGTQCHHCKCDGPAYAHTPTPHHLTPANGFDRTHTHILPTHTTHGVTATTHTLTHRYTHAPSHSLNCLPSAMQSKTTNHRSELRQSLLTGDSAFVAARSGFGQVTTTSTRSCAKHMDQGSVLNAIRHRGKKHHSRPPDPAPACVCCCKRAHMARHWLGVVKSARRCVHSFVELSCG